MILGVAIGLVLTLAGFSLQAVVVISIAFIAFVYWLIREINFIRNSHGTNIEELESEVEELKKSWKNLKKIKHKND